MFGQYNKDIDCPVTVTAAITRPSVFFKDICNIHKLFILYYIMNFNSVMQWEHIIIN